MVIQVMIVRYQLHIGSDQYIVFYRNASGRHKQRIVHYHDILPYAHAIPAHDGQRRHNPATNAYMPQKQLFHELIVLLGKRHRVIDFKT